MRSRDNAVEVDQLSRVFDVSAPWLNRVLERKPKRYLQAVQDVSFIVRKGTCLVLVGESGCDEPTSALDVSVQAQILNLMRDLQDRLDLTFLFISHNLAVVRHMADRIAVMYLGRIIEEAATKDLFADPRHPYTRLLLDTIPDVVKPNRARKVMGGAPPSPLAMPPGCAFHPRGPLAQDICRRQAPAYTPRSGAGKVACHFADNPHRSLS
ncbi:ABC transporter ATP-binding protein [Paenirhodobacter populi]|uniref:ABC transporter ATP-binding protein n=1 Tax=Paenirhodobacter populi TaxID=2306993 RepID=A0A443JFL2_9RHOB|nr:ABC transporter ATP-binding protein [Sinirhodobacter populi]RWR19327.1 ABC transporter ATP-binding protein [Sinirhodobacter populi]